MSAPLLVCAGTRTCRREQAATKYRRRCLDLLRFLGFLVAVLLALGHWILPCTEVRLYERHPDHWNEDQRGAVAGSPYRRCFDARWRSEVIAAFATACGPETPSMRLLRGLVQAIRPRGGAWCRPGTSYEYKLETLGRTTSAQALNDMEVQMPKPAATRIAASIKASIFTIGCLSGRVWPRKGQPRDSSFVARGAARQAPVPCEARSHRNDSRRHQSIAVSAPQACQDPSPSLAPAWS